MYKIGGITPSHTVENFVSEGIMQETGVQGKQVVQPEPLMTIGELATFLNVPKSWIYGHTRMAQKTGFPVVKAGKYCRFDRQEVLMWLRNGKGQEHD